MYDVSRRSLLGGFISAGAGMMISGCAHRAPSQSFFDRIDQPIGLQVYTLGDEAGRDLGATFASLAAIGYRDIELPSLYGQKPAAIAQMASDAGLAISSLHLAVSTRGQPQGLSLENEPEVIAEALSDLGARRAVMPIMPFPADFRPEPGEDIQAAIARSVQQAGADLWKQTAGILNARGAALKPLGVALGYHNHNLEFMPLGGTTGWEILVAETDPELVDFEIDTGWVATAGYDPAEFLAAHRGRVTQLHVKDVAADNVVNYALSMKPAVPGSGVLDWPRILPAAHAAGVRHFYVEQEPPFTIPRMEAVERAYAYLSQVHA